MTAFLDTSVLIATFYGEHEHHGPSFALFLQLKKSTACTAAHCLAEVYSVVTEMPGKNRSSPDEALLFLRDVRERLALITLDELEYFKVLEDGIQQKVATFAEGRKPPVQVAEDGTLKAIETSEEGKAEGRADAFVQDAALLYGIVREKAQYMVVGTSRDDMPIGAACRKGDSAPCDFISKEIAKFKTNGTLAREYHKWLYSAAGRFMP